MQRGFRGLTVVSGLCRRARAERREEREARRLFPETENVRRLTDYIVAIVIRWGIKRTLNAMELGRWSREEREGKPGNRFQRTKTFDDRPATFAAIIIRWGVKRTPNAMKLGRHLPTT